MTKYSILVQILEKMRHEAPKEYKKYYPEANETEKLTSALSRAFIHLYLKVKFGLLDFQARESLITDGTDDGGLDAYFIDKANKTVHVIQSKFRETAANFEGKEIGLDDLSKMEVDEIVKGADLGKNGRSYNGKIKQFQNILGQTEYLGQYKWKLVFLANFKHGDVLQKLYKDYTVEVFDYSRAYTELVFPVISGTYFKAENLHIVVSLDNVSGGNSRVSYSVDTSLGEAEVTLIFAPIKEIGAMMSKYRNSILAFNPRSYLGLATNEVNSKIADTIKSSKTNEFALFNNGITIVADEAGYSDKTGKKSVAHLELLNPQIINGGQTAYTLCKVYDDVTNGLAPSDVFDGKEVLLKIITIDPSAATAEQRMSLIENISEATNYQTKIDEADRRSNEAIQLKLQQLMYERHGLFYERKAGEFFDGLQAGYISEELIVEREQLMRVALASKFQVSETKARVGNFFSAENFEQQLDEQYVDKYAFGYRCLRVLSSELDKSKRAKNAYFEGKYGYALRYGRYAVVAVAINRFYDGGRTTPEQAVTNVLARWQAFEAWVKGRPNNMRYFSPQKADWVSYYKGKTVNDDIELYKFKDADIAA